MSLTALKAAALAAVLALPRAWFHDDHRPETTVEREARIGRVVSDVVDEAKGDAERIGYSVLEVTSLGLAFSYNESALAWEVHAGEEWPQRPPPFGDNGLARCFFQLQPSASEVPFDEWRPFELEQWESLAGLDAASTRLCAHAGVRTIAYHAHRCRTYLAHHRGIGDHRWVGSVIAAQYHNPRLPCGDLSVGSLRRGRLYAAFRYQIAKRLSQSQGESS